MYIHANILNKILAHPIQQYIKRIIGAAVTSPLCQVGGEVGGLLGGSALCACAWVQGGAADARTLDARAREEDNRHPAL